MKFTVADTETEVVEADFIRMSMSVRKEVKSSSR